MSAITQSCVVFLCMHALSFVKSQSSEDCALKDFLSSRMYDSNFDTSNLEASYTSGRQLRVSCNVGYSGFFKLTCAQGKWESKGTKCQPRTCGHPGDAQFADFHLDKGDDFVFGSQVVYTCQKGYQMVSRTNLRRCMADGWDGVVPVCEAQHCPVIFVNNNVHVNGDPEEATYGNVIRFSCKFNTEILVGPSEIYCNENGEWSAPAPTCIVIKCTAPEIENGEVLGDIPEYNEHEVLHFVCNRKYQRTEEIPSKCTKQGMRADWSPTPACELAKCRLKLPPSEGTTYEPTGRNVFSAGETLRVICGWKYWISTRQTRIIETTCNDEGEWSIRPVCLKVTCTNQRDRDVRSWGVRWGQQIELGDTTRYSCRSGYKSTDDTNVARCTRNGWSPEPLCQEITCDKLDIPHADNDNPDKQQYKNGEKAFYTCKEGYEGNPTRTCGRNGWTGYSQCTAITCPRKHFNNADIYGYAENEYRYKQKVEYICKNGFEGRFTLTCEKEGWTNDSQCIDKRCKRLHIDNAYITRNQKEIYYPQERVQYACTSNGNQFTITCSQGDWTGIKTCTDERCKRLDIERARITHNDKQIYDPEEQVQYACTSNGNQFTITCRQGDWTGIKTCTDERCKRLDIERARITHNDKEIYDPEERVQYACTSNGNQFTITCSQGDWTGTETCTDCPKAEVPHGFVVGPYNDTLYYTCDEGFKLFIRGWWGKATCNDGLWSGLEQCIEKLKCGQIPVIPNGEMPSQHIVYGQDERVQITCKEGFQAQVENLICEKGKWTSNGVPPAKICAPINSNCGPPPQVKNAIVLTSYQRNYLFDSEVAYECRAKYIIEGKRTLRCIDSGKWETENITCTPYCDKPKDDETMTFTAEKDRYFNDEVIEYQCIASDAATNHKAKCVNTNWIKTVDCAAANTDAN